MSNALQNFQGLKSSLNQVILGQENLIERLTIYKDEYTENVEHLGRILASVQETPESNVLIRKFVERVWM